MPLFLALFHLPYCSGFSLLAEKGGNFSVAVPHLLTVLASLPVKWGLMARGHQLLGLMGYELPLLALKHRLSSCGSQMYYSLACGIISVQGVLLFPALARGFFTTDLPEKSFLFSFLIFFFLWFRWKEFTICVGFRCIADWLSGT